jgi:WD40 repeat protein
MHIHNHTHIQTKAHTRPNTCACRWPQCTTLTGQCISWATLPLSTASSSLTSACPASFLLCVISWGQTPVSFLLRVISWGQTPVLFLLRALFRFCCLWFLEDRHLFCVCCVWFLKDRQSIIESQTDSNSFGEEVWRKLPILVSLNLQITETVVMTISWSHWRKGGLCVCAGTMQAAHSLLKKEDLL